MNRKAIIIVSVVLIAACAANAFAQKGGNGGKGKGGSGRKGNSGQMKRSSGGQQFGSGQHHFKSSLGSGQHHFGGGGNGKNSNGNQRAKFSVHNGNHKGHHHNNKIKIHHGHGHAQHGHGHYGTHHNKHFCHKYIRAQHHFAVRTNLYLVQFHNFPYDVCWHNGKYWVLFDGYWVPYTYLIQNHAGAWNWHQAHYKFHNHAYFKKNWKTGKVRLKYSK
ncbi:hypothetical protein [Mariniblastus fucicola]|uniref:Uncharacterized protein n=1 Tax=Mariniblastus fucicola TaxID=980251 RepID=A0A5B9PCJ4_9BACT|nr:hypothetical protein [Mariniblastus fucicola]QEG22875.1 hypothetical protein MFFC18_27620 [Mariniblastus fucicola]